MNPCKKNSLYNEKIIKLLFGAVSFILLLIVLGIYFVYDYNFLSTYAVKKDGVTLN